MHKFTPETQLVADEIFKYALERLKMDPPILDSPRSFEDLAAQAGSTITADGLGGSEALRLFEEVLAPACISVDHPRYLSFIPNAPTEYASLFDLVVGASGLYGGSWLEASGAVFAENQALRWIADLVGLPSGAGGVFVQGGTLGNLSALVAARDHVRRQYEGVTRWAVACSEESHSSITSATKVMDVDVIKCHVDEDGRLTGASVDAAIDEYQEQTNGRVFAVVATAGTTNLGIVDDLRSVGETAKRRGLWFHVDGAYGALAMLSPELAPRFHGIEQADSIAFDFHKWGQVPYDAGFVLIRDGKLHRDSFASATAYLKRESRGLAAGSPWPCDFGPDLSRGFRALKTWFTLKVYGTERIGTMIANTCELAQYLKRQIEASPELELLAPVALNIVCFRYRCSDDNAANRLNAEIVVALQESGIAAPSSTTIAGRLAIRAAIVNHRTAARDIDALVSATLALGKSNAGR
ncbi:L-2,4-diaminobutyrate decarboxylase [mine drainage metagenome]|uniref:L-2,4-diaminobutyrate decarboxylase n=1 Tax=mine drainage metagenome TaxID=410659 RepID=A0A1J5R2W3_9ZZZZ